MAVLDQLITDKYALYNADCVEVMQGLPNESIHLSVYSPPFATSHGTLFTYSSSDRDMSNCDSYEHFFDHYEFAVKELHRITMTGRMTAVHCMDVMKSNSGADFMFDFPGDIIRLHEKHGFEFAGRHFIWKEPLQVRNKNMQKNLFHRTMCEDSIKCGVATADQLVLFRKRGTNPIPVTHDHGFMSYAGERGIPSDILHYRGFKGSQLDNLYSHWIWRQYASSFWDDIRMSNLLDSTESQDEEDEKHIHPLQKDVIQRVVEMRSNPGETVLTPFMGIGSEVYVPVQLGRRGLGIELKTSYYNQAVKNLANMPAEIGHETNLLDLMEAETE